MKNRIKVKRYSRKNGIIVRSHYRFHRVPRKPQMIRAGVKEWYTPEDLKRNPKIIKDRWFDPPKKFIRLDRTNNWWRFRLIEPEDLRGMYIQEWTDEKGLVVRHDVMGFDRKTGRRRKQAVRYPIVEPKCINC